MRIIYLGTPDFAVAPLKSIVENGFNVVAVVSQTDKRVGRKQELKPTPVKEYALSQNIPVYQFEKISKEYHELKSLNADIMVTCAYGQILSQEVIDLTPKGVFNIHASLLPKYRGASPIQSVILNGETQTGVTIMKTDIGIDTGDIVSVEKVDILPSETAGELFDRLSVVGSELIVKTLREIESGTESYTPQNHDLATHSKMIYKQDAFIDFTQEAEVIYNKIRGYNPSPVAFAKFNGKILKIFKAEIVNASGQMGQVISADRKEGIVIACKKNAIKLLVVQMEGGKQMSAYDFVLGRKINVGDMAEKC